MKKTQWWKLLLFSFFLVLLLSSCAEDTPLLQELAQHGEWDALYHAAKKDFSETYRSGSLYYIALAQTERRRRCISLAEPGALPRDDRRIGASIAGPESDAYTCRTYRECRDGRTASSPS